MYLYILTQFMNYFLESDHLIKTCNSNSSQHLEIFSTTPHFVGSLWEEKEESEKLQPPAVWRHFSPSMAKE